MIVHARWFLLVACVSLASWATEASACYVQGRVVCVGTDTGVENVKVTLVGTLEPITVVTTSADGSFVGHVAWAGMTYDVSLDLSAAGVPGPTILEPQATCDVYATPMALPTYEVTVPACVVAPPKEADCSPGFYKNHPDTWCGTCALGAATCASILSDLGARGSTGAAHREAAKATLDACFGTAAASPCLDDDR